MSTLRCFEIRDPKTGRFTKTDAIERFWSKVNFLGKNGCWIWNGSTRRGYGQFSFEHTINTAAHRFAYEQLVGPIPEGLTIDHLCKNRLCVNPTHLEVVTRGENTLRGDSPFSINARKTHCPKGHPLTEDNLCRSVLKIGKRSCRTCRNIHAKAYQARRRNQ